MTFARSEYDFSTRAIASPSKSVRWALAIRVPANSKFLRSIVIRCDLASESK